ncbi:MULTISPECIES: response regulator [unclassified Coleofasciculus]|uniref:response regulator n=1 Tax=unclassified Coleofasciculus TaxID=2692782 RepID=UPI00187FEFCF|nr:MULTISPECIES: response regulator [unclassified Coleofasciculus]MBE9130095.1 response regulator [Coleofasciculus sp. LEGE 07081]MBE9152446.1 response regulator [Coleofasciculus sp. LEGE 07092]
MLDHPCRVLLVEDDPDDLEKLHNLLANAKSPSFSQGFDVICAETLDQGQQQLAQEDIDVVLLDLMLPDSRGMNTLNQMQNVAPEVPIIVQTVLEDEAIAVKVLELGSCGCLPKGKLDRNLLVYAIRSALERRQQLAALEEELNSSRQEQEIQLLEQLIAGSTHLSNQLPGWEPIGQRIPDVFEELVQGYGDLMDEALEQSAYKVDCQVSQKLSTLAEQVGLLKGTPRDIIEIHTQALKQKTQGVGLRKAQAYTREGRFLLLELMGNLATYYRRYFIGLNKINLAKNYDEINSK